MKFTQIPSDTFQKLQLNAGILVDDFDPASSVIGNIIGATTGGISFTATPNFTDFGDDVDNCPKNTKELKKIDSYDVSMTGTFVTVSANVAKLLVGAADETGGKITPRADLDSADFDDLWWVGDYSDENGSTGGGFIAIHMMNALSTGGFHIKSNDKNKGNFAFTFTRHYSINEPVITAYHLQLVEVLLL